MHRVQNTTRRMTTRAQGGGSLLVRIARLEYYVATYQATHVYQSLTVADLLVCLQSACRNKNKRTHDTTKRGLVQPQICLGKQVVPRRRHRSSSQRYSIPSEPLAYRCRGAINKQRCFATTTSEGNVLPATKAFSRQLFIGAVRERLLAPCLVEPHLLHSPYSLLYFLRAVGPILGLVVSLSLNRDYRWRHVL